uniref:Uncharacterized protein n=1 Tax=Plectus sambesii TaxID=2011161 RepID=A0A914XL25_9BILA
GYNTTLSAQPLLAFPTAAALVLSMQIPSDQLPYSPKRFYFFGFVDKATRFALDTPPLKIDHRAVDINLPGSRLSLVGEVIQAGRDAGLPSYTAFRAACRLPPVRSFSDLAGIVHEDALEHLGQLYESVDDIDLFSGGIAERPADGAMIGPTFACILSEAYQGMRRGDRFWYENFVYPSAFPEDQLSELRKTTLARIICDNTKVESLQPKALEAPNTFENCPVTCDNAVIPTLDWTQFTDATPKVGGVITREVLSKALQIGNDETNARFNRERNLRNPLSIVSRSSVLHFLVLRPTEHAQSICRIAETLLETTKVFMDRQQELLGISTQQMPPREVLAAVLPGIDVHAVSSDLPDDECVMHLRPCDHSSPYRTLTGWCNNLDHPEFGSAYNTYRRLLPAAYEDGINEPRQRSVSGRLLPSARKVSASFNRPPPPTHETYSHMMMQWGQFLDHDFTLTPISHSEEGGPLNCKTCDSRATVSVNCFPIEIPPNDPHFPELTVNGTRTCLPFTRSLPGQLTLGARQQINILSTYIDASNVYGSDICRAKKVRTFRNGLLDVQRTAGGEVLPANTEQRCSAIDPVRMPCLFAGDSRSNEQVGLSAMHIVWMREHNRIVQRLGQINPNWNDERLFQETRRIIGAMLQHITFNEFLPKVLGYKIMHKFDMMPLKQGFFEDYDDKCDATIANEFSTAAYRFGHTLIAEEYNSDGEDTMKFPLDIFFNPTKLYQRDGLDRILNAMAKQPCGRFDSYLAKGIRDHLFERKDDPHSGLDLPALNIQRARDHGLHPYVHYRRVFGLSVPRTFDDLEQIMERPAIDGLRKTYDSVEDIDLFPGLMSE